MNTILKFFNYGSNCESNCGDILDIELSSRDLGWEGIILEKGSSPFFHPENIYTPYFYFALATDSKLHWKAKTENDLQLIRTEPGEIWINPPNTPFTHEINEPCYFIILAIEEERFFKHVPLSVNRDQLRFLNNYNVEDAGLKHIIELFCLETQHRGRNGITYLHHLLAMAVNYYLSNYSNYPELIYSRQSPSIFGDDQMALIDRIIDERIGDRIRIETLADRLNYSKFHFLREFKKKTGMTPYQYIIEKKIIRGENLLKESQLSIRTIALELGFYDQSNFTRMFKSHFGVTPKRYRNQLTLKQFPQ